MTSHVPISKRLVLINSASALLTRALSLFVLLWLVQHLIDELPAAELALYYFVLALMTFVPLISVIVTSGLSRFVVEKHAQGDARGVVQVVSTAAPLCLGLAIAILGIGAVIASQAWRFVEHADLIPDVQAMIAILAVIAAVRLGVTPLTLGLTVQQRFVTTHLISLAGQIVFISALLTLLLGVGTRAVFAVAASLPQIVVEVGLMLWLSRRAMPALRWRLREFRRSLVGPIVSFGGWTMAARVATVSREAAAVLLFELGAAARAVQQNVPAASGASGTATELVTYRTGGLVESKVWPTALLPLTTTIPALTAMQATGQHDRLRRSYFRLCRYVLWSYLFIAAPLAVFHREFWSLYGNPQRYPDGGLVMLLLLGKAITVFCHPAMAQIAAARGKVGPMAALVVGFEAVNIGAMALVILGFGGGAVAVAAVTLVITTIAYPLSFWQLGLRLVGGRHAQWWRRTVLPGLLPGAVAVPVMLAVRSLALPTTWVSLGAEAAFGCAVFAATILLAGLDSSERADLRKVATHIKATLTGARGRASAVDQ